MPYSKSIEDYIKMYEAMTMEEVHQRGVLVTKAIVRNLEYYFGVFSNGARKLVAPIICGFCVAAMDTNGIVLPEGEYELYRLIMSQVFGKEYSRSDFDRYTEEASSANYLDKVEKYCSKNADLRNSIVELGIIVGFADRTLTSNEYNVVKYIRSIQNRW